LRIASLILLAAVPVSLFAQSGFVRSGGQALPGATVSAAQNGQSVSTVTDADGHYTFPPLAAGTWSVSVEMFGFQSLKKDVDYSTANGAVNFELQLKESPMLERLRQAASRAGVAGQPGNGRTTGTAGGTAAGDQAFEQELATALNVQNAPAPATSGENSNESFLVSGSLSPGMAQGAQADSGPDVRAFSPGFGGFGREPDGGGAPGFGSQAAGGPEAAVDLPAEAEAAELTVRAHLTAETDKWRARFSETAGGGISRFAEWHRFRCRTQR
jgi:Carboxypeptidase regulatory-like domain